MPLPGSGRTIDRWLTLAEISAVELVLGRLVEAHADARAICTELDGPQDAGLWGVWAAEPPTARVDATAAASPTTCERWPANARGAQ